MRMPIPEGATRESLMEIGLSRTTAWRALGRGWYVPNYHVRKVSPDSEKFDHRSAQSAALMVFYSLFLAWGSHKEDLVQEATCRIWEVSGVSTDFPFIFKVAHNAMRDYVARMRRFHGDI